jgi:DNA-binding transcriptional LysR family regulator
MEVTFRNLRYVLALSEHRHFGRAAEALGISQPALTRSIQSLEAELGVLLFERQGREGIEPTVFGKLLLDKGRSIVLHSDELLREIDLTKGLEIGELRISSGLYPTELSVAKAVGNYIQRYPKMKCEISIRDWRTATEDVHKREADIAVAETSEVESNEYFQVEPVAKHRLVFFCRKGHPILRQKNLQIDHIAAYPWVTTRAPKRIVSLLPKSLGPCGSIDPMTGDFVPAVLVKDHSSSKIIVSRCDGIGAAPLRLIEEEIAKGILRELVFNPPWLCLQYGFIYLRHRTLAPSTIAFMQEVRAIEAEMASL